MIIFLSLFVGSQLTFAVSCDSFKGIKSSSTKYTYWGFHVYDLEYTGDKPYPESPYALDLLYKRDFKGQKIAEVSADEMKRLGANDEQIKRWSLELNRIIPDVQSGDRLRGYVDKDKKTYFCQGNKILGEVADPDFAKYFFGIWLGEDSRRADVRKKLLGVFNEADSKN